MTASWSPPGRSRPRCARRTAPRTSALPPSLPHPRARQAQGISIPEIGRRGYTRVLARRTPPLVGGRGARILGLTRTEGAPMLEDSRGPATGGVLLVGSVPL